MVDHHLKIIETGDRGVGEHTHSNNSHHDRMELYHAPNDITFFQRFQDDILAGRKTITIRNAAESHFKTGDVLRVGRYEDDGYFAR